MIILIICLLIILNMKRIRYFLIKRTSVIRKGKINFSLINKLHYSLDNLIRDLKVKDVKKIEEVDYAVLKKSGKLKIYKEVKDYPIPLILDGEIDYISLSEIKKSDIWLYHILSSHSLKLEDIFYAFFKKGNIYLIKKS